MRTETRAILFADITGSTQLYDTLGDTLALEQIGRCISLLSEVVKDHHGRVVKTIGDEIMAAFPAARAAVNAAAAMQRRMQRTEFPVDREFIQLRIGLHYGPVVVQSGDLFGDSVNIAAWLVKLANPGQILTSKASIDALSANLISRTRDLGHFAIKGKRESVNVYEVLIDKDADLTASPGGSFALEMPRVYLLLRFKDREIFLHEEGHTVSIGRDAENDLVIKDQLASRRHARIEYTHGNFALMDLSTNGTFVLTEKKETIYLRREKLILRGTGHISPGKKFEDKPAELIHFACMDPITK